MDPKNGAVDSLNQLDHLIKASNKTFEDIFAFETINQNSDNIFPLNMALIKSEQESCEQLQNLQKEHPDRFGVITQDDI